MPVEVDLANVGAGAIAIADIVKVGWKVKCNVRWATQGGFAFPETEDSDLCQKVERLGGSRGHAPTEDGFLVGADEGSGREVGVGGGSGEAAEKRGRWRVGWVVG